MLTHRIGKKGPSLYTPEKRHRTWKDKAMEKTTLTFSSEAERQKRVQRDEETWRRMPPLNSQILTYWHDKKWDA